MNFQINTRVWLLCGLALVGYNGFAQQNRISISDAVSNPAFQPISLKQLQFRPGSDNFVYVQDIKGTDYLLTGNPEANTLDTLLSAPKLTPTTTKIPAITWVDQNRFYYQVGNSFFMRNIAEKSSLELFKLPAEAEISEVNPNATQIAYTVGNNLFVTNGAKTTSVSDEKNADIVFGQSVHRNEFGINKGLFWSGKGNMLAFYRMDQTMVTNYPIVDVKPYPAETRPIKYPMAGQKSHHVTVGVFNAVNGKSVYLETGKPEEQYLTNIAWSPDEKVVYIAVLNREQNHMKFNAYNAITGAFIKTLFEEKHAKYVEPQEPMLFLPTNPDKFIWQSARDGYNHLYLYTTNGTLLKQLTSGPNLVTEVSGISADGNSLFYTATGNNGLDRDFYLHNLKTGKNSKISSVSGTHVCSFSQSGKYFTDNYANLSLPKVVEIGKVGKGSIRKLLEAPNPIAGKNISKIELGQIKADDGTPLNTILIKPYDFNPAKKYPVLVYVYGGPHAQLVTNSWLGGSNLWLNYMAQQGYVVFTVDGRGSANRGKAFEDATFRQLGTVEMNDQLKGVAWLKSQPYVDSTRMGVYGWSFGGFMTTSLMTKYPKVFKVAVAGGPVIDWSLYEIMYTERYMDTPQENPDGFAKSNLLNHAKNLEGKLLMIHGTADDVVVWQHSQLFVKKCVEEGKLLDYFVYPGHAHNVRGKDRLHLMRKISAYFQDYL